MADVRFYIPMGKFVEIDRDAVYWTSCLYTRIVGELSLPVAARGATSELMETAITIYRE